jgi:hypothetical protein
MTLIYAMVLGGDCIDDFDVLRSGRLSAPVGPVAAPSTLGTFLRAFTFGHVRQLDRLPAETLSRAWQAGAGPGGGRLVVDVDSFIARSTATPSRALGSATHAGAAITRCWPRAPTPPRSCTSARGKGRRAARGVPRFAEEFDRARHAPARAARRPAPKLLRAGAGACSTGAGRDRAR